MVGSAARIRLSSVTLPSCIGTLKSTRMKTRFPLRSMSFTVFLFMIAPRVYKQTRKQVHKCWIYLLVHLSTCLPLLQALCHERSQVGCPAGVSPLVIVPRNHLDHVADDKRIHRTEHRRVGRAAQVGGD